MKLRIILLPILAITLFTHCTGDIQPSQTLETAPGIYPDYTGVTIPPNIAPLNFRLDDAHEKAVLTLQFDDRKKQIKEENGQFTIPPSFWKKLLKAATGQSIELTLTKKENGQWIQYKPFKMQVAKEPIDPYIAYRLIEPGYAIWNIMGLYQRNLESYKESPIIENKMTNLNCINCHSFPNRSPEKMLFHIRGNLGSTVLVDGKKVEKLNTKTDETISALVYPYWHPSEKFIAFSVNETRQSFHTRDSNRIEVFDLQSDIVVYDIEKHEIITTPPLFSDKAFESFPSFSPDGKTLYFSTADVTDMPEEYNQVKYSLCAIAFDPVTRTFGTTVDTLYHAKTEDKSASFPRVSPDGKHLLFGVGAYGGFFVWHKEADLYMYNFTTGAYYPLAKANSTDAESYHSWSSNSRWIVYSSRRTDGLYTRPCFAYIDDNGSAHKAFLLPQREVRFYEKFVKAYNVPEFITGKVTNQGYRIGQEVKNNPGIQVTFGGNK